MYRLTYIPDRELGDQFVLPTGIDERGSYNVPPSPYRPAHEHEFIHAVRSIAPLWLEYRQLKHLASDLPWTSCWIYWMHANAWIVVNPNRWHSRDEQTEGPGYRLVWDDPVRYFKVGCDHQYKTMSRPNRWTEIRTCQVCGHEIRVED